MTFNYYVHTSPNSHFYTDLDHIVTTLNHFSSDEDTLERLRHGIVNTIKQGYRLTKEKQSKFKLGDLVKYSSEQEINIKGEVVSVKETKMGFIYGILRQAAVIDERVLETTLGLQPPTNDQE